MVDPDLTYSGGLPDEAIEQLAELLLSGLPDDTEDETHAD